MNDGLPLISVVLPVFNKQNALPDTLFSLWNQVGRDQLFLLELVLVDDASTDSSVEVAARWALENNACLKSSRRQFNSGPSVCLNEAVSQASGKWVLVFDADDIAPANVVSQMFSALLSTGADYIYGRSKKTLMTPREAFESRLPKVVGYLVSDNPCRFMLDKRIVHPVVLLKREHFLAVGGASPQIFIQDESLACRLARQSSRAALIDLPCRYVLHGTSVSHLSSNQLQQHHDQYLAAREALLSDKLPDDCRAGFAGKCLSAYWKSQRSGGSGVLALPLYLLGKVLPRLTYAVCCHFINNHFSSLNGVRRMAQTSEEE